MISQDDIQRIEAEEAKRLERLGFRAQPVEPPVAGAPFDIRGAVRRFEWPSRRSAAATVAVLVVITWVLGTFTSCQDRRWEDTDGYKFIVGENLWGTPMDRMMISPNGDRYSGPVTKMGTHHGLWLFWSNDPDVRGFRQWYWYGKEVTAEEFERLSAGH